MEINELRMLQALPLEVKIMKSKARIEEWYRYYCGKVYISFSGGKDSTVLLHLVRSIYPDVEAVFIDTGLEFPEIRAFVKTIDNVTTVRPKMQFNKVIEKYGYPAISKEQSHYITLVRNTKSEVLKHKHIDGINRDGSKTQFTISNKWKYLINAPFKISDQCCQVMKKRPVKKYEHETGNMAIIGTMTEESVMREKVYLKNGCNAFENTRPISAPISFWSEEDIWNYMKLYNIPYSKIYDMGYKRTGCMFCMYGAHLEKGINRFQLMQTTHPKQYEYCIKDVEQGGLGIGKVLDYINVSYRKDLDDKKTTEGVNYQQYRIV